MLATNAEISRPQTMYDKIWGHHLVEDGGASESLLYVDRHYVHEVTSPQAFEGLRMNGRSVRRPDLTFATMDHSISTLSRDVHAAEELSRRQIEALVQNCRQFHIPLFDLKHPHNGIVHIIGPELGLTLPGMVIVCGDSHTSTHGAFGALSFGIGTSEVEHVLTTQTILQSKAKNMLVRINGLPPLGVTAKDVILAIIGKIGTRGGQGHVIEYEGECIRNLSMEGRMTVCNMSIEAGARAGLISPDEKTFAYLKRCLYSPTESNGSASRPSASRDESDRRDEPDSSDEKDYRASCSNDPTGRSETNSLEYAISCWKELASHPDASYDRVVELDAESIEPQITWGTNPSQTASINDRIPFPEELSDEPEKDSLKRALSYMGLSPGLPMSSIEIDRVFIGSCTNGRIEDLRCAAGILRGKRVHSRVRAMVVPGSVQVFRQAQSEGLDSIFREAGFEWRYPGCSMCLAMNDDVLAPEERCASTSNRNFEGRQEREAGLIS